jgi:hypothetical protein
MKTRKSNNQSNNQTDNKPSNTWPKEAYITLPALVGHPLLFLEDSPEVNVELVLAEPELHVGKEKGGLKLTVTPALANAPGEVLVTKDTPTRFKIYRFRPEHLQLINLLGAGLTIPKTGEGLARQAVEALSSVLTVHSDLEGANRAASVQADCRPHAHILPYREGISLEFLVKPIETGSSSFTPGKGSRSVLAVIDGKTVQAVRDPAEEKKRLAGIVAGRGRQVCPDPQRHRLRSGRPPAGYRQAATLRSAGGQLWFVAPGGRAARLGFVADRGSR